MQSTVSTLHRKWVEKKKYVETKERTNDASKTHRVRKRESLRHQQRNNTISILSVLCVIYLDSVLSSPSTERRCVVRRFEYDLNIYIKSWERSARVYVCVSECECVFDSFWLCMCVEHTCFPLFFVLPLHLSKAATARSSSTKAENTIHRCGARVSHG